MLWKLPPRIKVYEAIGAIADGRIEFTSEWTAKVKSSTGSKAYDVAYNPETKELSVNDNGSFWHGYVGYPGLAFLMMKNLVPFDSQLAVSLKDLEWKKINTQFKNDFSKTEQLIYESVSQHALEAYAQNVLDTVQQLALVRPVKRQRPPFGD